MTEDWWLTLAFVTALVPASILLFLYGFRTRFWSSATGWAFFWLIFVTVASYGLSLLALVFEDWAASDTGMIIRTVARFVIAAVLWNLLRVFLKAQRSGKIREEQERLHEEVHSGDPEPG